MSNILVGTCNWSDHADFYPAGLPARDQLAYYAQYFPIVEVDSTYYALQRAHNFELWCERTPPGFLFNVKAYKELTKHDREKEPSADTFERFSAMIDPMRQCGKLRALHFQFPPWFKASEENREYLATVREFFPDDLLAVEFRHRGWLEAEERERTLATLSEQAMVYVMVDEPQVGSGSVPPTVAVTNPALAIVRFHGRNAQTWYKRTATTGDRFKYLYGKDELAEWLPRVEQVQAQVAEVHLLLNNNYGNYAVRNARDLRQLFGQEAAAPLPPPTSEQPTLL